MSEIDDTIQLLSEAATRADITTNFFDDVTTLGEESTVTNNNNGKTVPSVQKQVKDLYDGKSEEYEAQLQEVLDDFEIEAQEALDNLTVNLVGIGGYTEQVLEGSGSTNVIDASNYNTCVVSTTDPLSVTNIPAGSYTLTVLLTTNTLDLTSFTTLKWAGAEVPTWTTSDDLIFFTTIDQGVTWYASAGTGYGIVGGV